MKPECRNETVKAPNKYQVKIRKIDAQDSNKSKNEQASPWPIEEIMSFDERGKGSARSASISTVA